MTKRHNDRLMDEVRPISIKRGVYEYAAGSVLFEMGRTKVLCAVTMQPSVPSFLRGQGTGWLTAEYSMLPAATAIRTNRESSTMRKQGRSVEISRLISRSLRTIADLSQLGERTITVDCDILQADGGTRTASISAAYIALEMAQRKWLKDGLISAPFLKETIAAVSVCMLDQKTLVLDPDYKEDSSGIADINFVMTYSGKLIELQGGAEKEPLEWDCILKAGELARNGIAQIKAKATLMQKNSAPAKKDRVPFFSLKNRQSLNSQL